MRILVQPHDMAIGGSQLNAIEIAAAVQRAGHPTVVFGRPGPLVERVAELGLEFVAAPEPMRRPSPAIGTALLELVDSRRIEVLHGYEWPPALECLLASRRRRDTVAVATVLSMAVAPFIPKSMPLLVGSEQIAAAERCFGRRSVGVLEPPVDLRANGPDGAGSGAAFRTRWQLDPNRYAIVCVTRLARELKLEGLLAAMDAVAALPGDVAAQLVIVGDGPARDVVHARAAQVNARCGAGTIVLTGELADPRPAYAAADVALGMGGSALRAMAFGKPLVVQGEGGYWRLLTPESVEEFLWVGWYGYGCDPQSGAARLHDILVPLLADPAERTVLGKFGRSVVEDRFSLTTAASTQIDFYERALRGARGEAPTAGSDTAAAARFVNDRARRKIGRLLSQRPADDFNARPVAGRATSTRENSRAASSADVVYFSGVQWDAVAGTDRHLVSALARHRPVLWVDPPTSWLAEDGAADGTCRISQVGAGITRLHAIGPPGISRAGVRAVSRRVVLRAVLRLLQQERWHPRVVVASTPEPSLADWPDPLAMKLYYATDDFVAGAGLLGYSTRFVERARRSNVAAADLVLAVSRQLVDVLVDDGATNVDVLANGCDADRFAAVPDLAPVPDVTLARPIAGLVGQLNDRIDVELLEAVADLGDSLLLVGPRSERTADVGRRLDALVARPNVQWVGPQRFDRLPGYLAAMDVGLTPYTDTAFNRASHPLKTLEYLAAGKPVVSTDLPAARSFDADVVVRVRGAAEFGAATHRLLAERDRSELVAHRQAVARRNSWAARADALEDLIQQHLGHAEQER